MHPLYILVADGNLSDVRYITEFLLKQQHRVETADKGTTALSAALRRRGAGDPYHLVIAELNLPGLDAIGLARELRRQNDQTPVLVHATGIRTDPVVAQVAGGLGKLLLHERPIGLSTLELELLAIIGQAPRPAEQPFFGTVRIGMRVPITASYTAPAEVDPPDRQDAALERRIDSPVPGTTSTERRRVTPTRPTGSLRTRPDGSSGPYDIGTGRKDPHAPSLLPTTVTARIRRSITGQVTAAPPPNAPSLAPGTSGHRRVLCAHCNGEFTVAVKTETYTTICIICGKPNRIEP